MKIDNDLSRIDIIFKREDSDKICMSISEKIDNRNLVEIERIIIYSINLHVPIREQVYVVLYQEYLKKYT